MTAMQRLEALRDKYLEALERDMTTERIPCDWEQGDRLENAKCRTEVMKAIEMATSLINSRTATGAPLE